MHEGIRTDDTHLVIPPNEEVVPCKREAGFTHGLDGNAEDVCKLVHIRCSPFLSKAPEDSFSGVVLLAA